MKKYEELLQVVKECDYRLFDGEYYRKEDGTLAVQGMPCGCQVAEARCLLGRGGWDRDPHEVNPNDCLECTKLSDIEMRILNMQRLLQELLIRIVALENRLTTSEQQHSGLWY